MRLIVGTFTALALSLSAPLAPASAQGAITPGMPVTDASGGSVGAVAGVKGDNLLIKTDKHEVLLPKSSFSVADGKLLFGMTRAQLNAEVEATLAAANSAIVAGAKVNGAAGAEIGTIEAVDADTVTIALPSGQKIQVGKGSLRGNPDGTVTSGYTAEQLQAAIEGKAAGDSSDQ